MSDHQTLQQIREALSKVIQGKNEVIELMLMGVLATGHILIEDSPGVGKTTLAKAIAKVFDMQFARVQFTPDLLPTDILGAQILDPREGTFTFHQGPIFASVVLADEINRASPRTQSALLEAMSEGQATVDGVTYPLPKPFLVLATQNPVDSQGTYPLPEAQLDRFLLRLSIGYPARDAELAMLFDRQKSDPLDDVKPVISGKELLVMQSKVRDIQVKEIVAKYLLSIVNKTREQQDFEVGVSPRGSLALFRAAQAWAFLNNRSYVSPADISHLVPHLLAHRVSMTSEARYGGKTAIGILQQILKEVPVPV